MGKHSPLCWVLMVLAAVGGLNWVLYGLGSFIGTDLNLVRLIFGGVPALENVVYMVAGASMVFLTAMGAKSQDCGCQKMGK